MIYYSIFLILFTITIYSIWYICYIYKNTCIIETFETDEEKRKRYGDRYDELVLNRSKTFDEFLKTQYTFQDATNVPDSIKSRDRSNWLPEKEEYVRQSVDCVEGWDYPNIDDAQCLLDNGTYAERCLSADIETRDKIPQGMKKRNWIIRTNPKYGGSVCTSNYNILVETKQCPDLLCDVNCRGSWVQTGISTECEKHNAECGEQQLTTNAIRGKGRQEIYYTFNKIQHSSNNGIPCPLTNPNPQYQDCDYNKCPKKCIGNWNPDNVYSAQCVIPSGAVCDKSSGKKKGTRTRTYTIQAGNNALNGGIQCPFANGTIDPVECDENCKVDCEYTDWSAPSGCTAQTTSCGQQCIQTQSRSILYQAKNGGTACGSTTQDLPAVPGTKCNQGICNNNKCSYDGFPINNKFVFKLPSGNCLHPNDGRHGISTDTKLVTWGGCDEDRLYFNAIPSTNPKYFYLQHTKSQIDAPLKCLKGWNTEFDDTCSGSDPYQFIPSGSDENIGYVKNLYYNKYWMAGDWNEQISLVNNISDATSFTLHNKRGI